MHSYYVPDDFVDYTIIDLPNELKNSTGVERMEYIYNSEFLLNYFSDGWKILSILHGKNKLSLYKKIDSN